MTIGKAKEGFTVYITNKDTIFRIVEISKDMFIVQQKRVYKNKTGFLWWKKTEDNSYWYNPFAKKRNTKKECIELIESLEKYPIYH